MELIIAGGYPYPYRSVSAELAAANADNWSPVTVDLRATAAHSCAQKKRTAGLADHSYFAELAFYREDFTRNTCIWPFFASTLHVQNSTNYLVPIPPMRTAYS